jgi:hypothetical protein
MIPRVFLGFYTSSKLENKHMQCRNTDNMKLKKAHFEKINTSKEMINKLFEKLAKTKIRK